MKGKASRFFCASGTADNCLIAGVERLEIAGRKRVNRVLEVPLHVWQSVQVLVCGIILRVGCYSRSFIFWQPNFQMTSVLKSSMIELLSPVLGREGFELVDVEFQGENRATTVRFLIYKPDGITVRDCQRVSRMVHPILEVHGLIDSGVALEVASPGIDRPLASEADFRRNIGREVQIETASATGESLQLSGTVIDVKDGIVCLDESGKVTELQISTIIRAQIQLMW